MPLVVAINAWQTPRHEGFDAGRHRGKTDSLHAQMKGLWATPRNSDANGVGAHGDGGVDLRTQVSAWQTPQTSDTNGVREYDGKRGIGLNTQVWHSPSASDGEGGRVSAAGTSPTGKRPDGTKTNTTLANDMRQASEAGSLNADWVEGLMNFPRGWTDLDVATPTPWRGWPSLPHEPQHVYEAPRTLPKGQGKRRNKRLKALGNAVVPSQAAPLFAAINQFERSQMDTEGGVTP